MLEFIISSFNNVNNNFLVVLFSFMFIDIITGLIKSISLKNVSSKSLYTGLLKKLSIIIIIIMVFLLDSIMFFDNVMVNTVIVFYIGYEIISILENISFVGIKLPEFLIKYLKEVNENE